MSETMEYRTLALPQVRKPVTGRLKALLGALLNRGAGAPTKIRPDALSGYMLKDIGLDDRGRDRDRSLMDWPIR